MMKNFNRLESQDPITDCSKLQRTTEVEGGVKTIAVEDRTGTTIHKHILSLCEEGKEMLSFTFKQYNRTSAEKKCMQPSDLDFLIKSRFARIRFVLLFLWLERMKVSYFVLFE